MRPEVYQHEAEIGFIACCTGHAGIEPDISVFRDVVIALWSLNDSFLSEQRIPESFLIFPIIIQFFIDQRFREYPVYPGGNIGKRIALWAPISRIVQDHSRSLLHCGNAGIRVGRADIIRIALIVNLERRIAEQHRRIGKPQPAVKIVIEIGRRNIFHLLAEPLKPCISGCRIHQNITRNTLGSIPEILDQPAVGKRRHPISAAFIGNLAIFSAHIKLRNKIRHLPHDLIPDQLRAFAVNDRSFRKIESRNFWETDGFGGNPLRIITRPE